MWGEPGLVEQPVCACVERPCDQVIRMSSETLTFEFTEIKFAFGSVI